MPPKEPSIALPTGPPELLARIIIGLANGSSVRIAPKGSEQFSTFMQLDRGDERLMWRWLDALVQKAKDEPVASPAARTRALNEIRDAFGDVELRGARKSAVVKGGRISLNFDLELFAPTNRAKLGWFFANVCNAGYDKYIRWCPECTQFFFDKPSGRPIKWFCTPAHANAFRQREYRSRQS